MAGASVNKEFLQSLTLQEWLEKARTRVYTKYPGDVQLAMLTKVWELAIPGEYVSAKQAKKKKK
jgi:hypothetical protein